MFKSILFAFALMFANNVALACDFDEAINFAKVMHPNFVYEGMSSSKIVIDYQEIEIYLAAFVDESTPGLKMFCDRIIVCDPNDNSYHLKQMMCRDAKP